MEEICWQITVAAFMQPLQQDLRSPAAKDNCITQLLQCLASETILKHFLKDIKKENH